MAHARSLTAALKRIIRAAQRREQKAFARRHITRFSLEDKLRSETVCTPLALQLTEKALKQKFSGQPIFVCAMSRFEAGEILRDSQHCGTLERITLPGR